MKQGFTLIEMLVVFTILGIISMVGVYSYQTALRKGEIDAFVSGIQTQLTPVVYGQGSESGVSYADFNDFKLKSVNKFGPGSSPSNGGVKGLVVTYVGGTLNTATNATESQLKSIKIYNKIGNFASTEKNTFYINGGSSSDTISKTIAIPPGVIFDSACLVADSHASCDDATPATGTTAEYSIAYHGSNPSPYVFSKFSSNPNPIHVSGSGLRLNFRNQLEPTWYTVTFSPYGGMSIGRRCTTKECL